MVFDEKIKVKYVGMIFFKTVALVMAMFIAMNIALLAISSSTASASERAGAGENETHKAASQAVGFSGGWITGSGVTYRRYFGDHFLQGTFFGVTSDSANNTYVNTAFSAGTYLHKLKASGIIPPLGLKIMAGADLVVERRAEESAATDGGSQVSRTRRYSNSYYGGGVGLDIGNPGRAGLSLWIAVNYVVAYDGITSPTFEWFGARPAAGILYGW